MINIDPSKTVDRQVEETKIGRMLSLADDRRLLVIGDAKGTGKSTLLRLLRYKCMWVHKVSGQPRPAGAGSGHAR